MKNRKSKKWSFVLGCFVFLVYTVEVRSDLQFAQAIVWGGLFAKVFHPQGLICYARRQSLSDDTTLRLSDDGLKLGKVDCEAKLREWLFF